ncbi:unnamed protein product, partial [Staurois parvus]
WAPRATGDHRAPVSLPKLKKAYEKGTRSISWGPLLTPDPQASSRNICMADIGRRHPSRGGLTTHGAPGQ